MTSCGVLSFQLWLNHGISIPDSFHFLLYFYLTALDFHREGVLLFFPFVIFYFFPFYFFCGVETVPLFFFLMGVNDSACTL